MKSLHIEGAYEMLCEIYGVLEIFNYKNIINYPIFYLSFCNSEFEGGMYYNFYIRMQPTFKNDEGLIGIIMLVFEENKLKTVKVCK